jgi:predicted anti-sigma-YlaC factor YlaD
VECELARERVSLQLDDELSAHETLLLDRHLAVCSSCERFAGGVRASISLLRAAPLEQSAGLVSWRRVPSLPLSGRAAALLASTAAAVLVAVSLAPSSGNGNSVGFASTLTGVAVNPPTDANLGVQRPAAPQAVVRRPDNSEPRRDLFGV